MNGAQCRCSQAVRRLSSRRLDGAIAALERTLEKGEIGALSANIRRMPLREPYGASRHATFMLTRDPASA